MTDITKEFLGKKYVNLETFKKDGTGVKTPVWFIANNDTIYIITKHLTGKAKRLKNSTSIRICTCTFGGHPTSQWHSGTAKLIEGQEAEEAIKLRNKKYGLQAKLIVLFTKSKGRMVVYSICLD